MKYANKWIHKSHVKLFECCPKKFDLLYDEICRKSRNNCSLAINEGLLVHDWHEILLENPDLTDDEIIEHIEHDKVRKMVLWMKYAYLNLYPRGNFDLAEATFETESLLRGTVDRYVDYGDKKILFEIKTGKYDSFSKTSLDFAFYTLLLEEAGLEVTHWVLVNPRTFTIKEEPVKQLSRIKKMIWKIRTAKDFPAKPGFWCVDCPLRYKCNPLVRP